MTPTKLMTLVEAYRTSGGSEEHHARRDHLMCAFEDIEQQLEVAPMAEVADRYAHRMAMTLECVLMDRASDRWWSEGMALIGEYRSAMNAIHEQHSPTFMGEPVLHNAGDKPPQVGLD